MALDSNRGGKRPGAGRKSKVENEWMVAAMDSELKPGEYWQHLAKGVRAGSDAAQRLWASYRFGLPKQTVAIEEGSSLTVNFKNE